MGEKWPKIDHIPPQLYFEDAYPPHLGALGAASHSFPSTGSLVPRVGAAPQELGSSLGLYDKRWCRPSPAIVSPELHLELFMFTSVER